jgi:hypothetical protein
VNLVTAYGAPFHIHLSSNSDLLPRDFRWTQEDTPIKVFIDAAIPVGLDYQKKPGEKKIAWVCESRSIFYEWGVKKEVFNSPSSVRILEQCYDALFFSDRQYCTQSPKFHYAMAGSNLPWAKNQQVFNKTKLVSMVASPKKMTKGHFLRHEYAEKFLPYIDLFGGALGSRRIGSDSSPWPDKSEAINDYMFQIVIENDSYSTYFTEKVTDCFATGTIPVYWGAPDIGEHFNMDGIIVLNEQFDIKSLTPDLYYSKLDAVKYNFNLVQNMIGADDLLFRKINEL